MRLNRATVFEIGLGTYRIEMLGRINCYLLIGRERGLLIDCGFGLEPMKPMVDELCPLPYDVCITHADGDHMGACYEWEKVWMHPADNDLAHDLLHVNFQRFTGFRTTPNPMIILDEEEECGEFYRMDELDPITLEEKDLPEFLPLADGQIFDLGGRTVTVLCVPGHTNGSTVYIDSATRILFSGDAISQASDIKTVTAADGKKNMERLLNEYGDQFDRVYPAHTGLGPGARRMNLALPKSIINDYMEICQKIIDKTVDIRVRDHSKPNPDFKKPMKEPPMPKNMPANLKMNPDEKQAIGVVETAHPYGLMEHFNFRPE
jgi:glyoxylase-like metal-dependent hydrolase (beta-lactamase superfamily II)